MNRPRLFWPGLLSVLSLSGCALPLPPPLTEANVKAAELPGDEAALIAYADEAFQKQSVPAVEDSIIAVDKALGVKAASYAALWRAARACAWLSYERWDDQPLRAEFAYRGTEYAKAAIKLENVKVEGNYFLAVNLGQWASTRTVGAVSLVTQVVKYGKAARAADERFDHAGPLRLLGSVYVRAPAWPVSVGDTDEGLKLLARAVELAGDFPENHLLRAEALAGDKQTQEAEREFGVVVATEPAGEWSGRLERWKREAESGMKKSAPAASR